MMWMPEPNSRSPSVAEEAGLARDRAAVDRAGEMADHRARHPPVEHDRHPLGLDLARIEPLDRALAGGAPDPFGRIEIGAVDHRGIVVVALHRGALARDRHRHHALAGAQIGAVKALAGHQHHAADPGRRRRPARLAHALDRERGGFGLLGALLQERHRRQIGIEQCAGGRRELRRMARLARSGRRPRQAGALGQFHRHG
jgi:hypothetical protein